MSDPHPSHMTARAEATATDLRTQLAPLIGGTVTVATAIVDNDNGWAEAYPILQIRTADGRTFQLELLADEEGNGPGHPALAEL